MNKPNAIKLFPSTLKGTLNAPPSKSMTHRALLAAALCPKTSIVSNIIFSDDVIATINAIKKIGATVETHDSSVSITGIKKIKRIKHPIDCNESGSTLRFMIPIASLSNKKVTFTGSPSLLSRPQSIYKSIFDSIGVPFEHKANKIVINGSIKAKEYVIDGRVSSQFFTGLMYSLPLLKEDSKLIIQNKLESESYIKLTISVLKQYGIDIQTIENGYFIPGNQQYKPSNFYIEGDYSQAAFFFVAGTRHPSISIRNLNPESVQGDRVIVSILKHCKTRITHMENGYKITKSDTTGRIIDIKDCPDLGPILALFGAFCSGTTTITNCKRLRYKESDRIKATVSTLSDLGVTITATDNTIIVKKSTLKGGVTVDSYNDHRIAMMISIAASLCEKPVTLTNPMSISKSYPKFYKDYKSIGGIIKQVSDNS